MRIDIIYTMSYIVKEETKDLADIESKSSFVRERWNIVDSYMDQYQKKQILSHQFESFHHFMEKLIPEKIYSYNPLVIHNIITNQDKNDKVVKEVKCEINFENHYYEDPIFIESNGKIQKMYPHDARQRDLTYSVSLISDLRINCEYIEDGVITNRIVDNIIPKCTLGKIPIYVRSKYCLLEKYKDSKQLKNECKFDKGAYTIINGNEKVIVSQEKMCDNRISIFKAKRNTKYEYVCSIRSMNPESKVSYKISILGSLREPIVVKISHIKKEIPLFVFLRAMGLETDKQIIRAILLDEHKNVNYLELLEPSIEQSKKWKGTDSSLEYISKLFTIQMSKEDKVGYVRSWLEKNILPHLGEEIKTQYILLGYMVKILLDILLEKRPKSDRDHYGDKRVDQPGYLMGRLFHYLIQKMIKDLKDTIVKDISTSGLDFSPDNIIIKSSIMENGFKYALATGDWNVKIGNNYSKLMGVAQVLNRLNNVSTQSHLRRINTPIDKSVKLIKPRRLHGTHIGKICPAETPEGASVGVVKNATLSCSITIDTPEEPILQILIDHDLILIDEINIDDITAEHTKVFVNGNLIGFHTNPHHIVEFLKHERRKGAIADTASSRYNINAREIIIYTDCGRPYRPLFIVKDGKINITAKDIIDLHNRKIVWNDFISRGIIEYLDTEEEESCLIAMNIDVLKTGKGYTHCEIDESFIMLGLCASLIPFPDHNQSPRNSYQSAMCKQALGIYASNYSKRFDTVGYILAYSQMPLVRTKMSKHLNYDDLPCGQNIIVAFGCWSGYNQEDSVILNKSSIERNLFECYTFKTYKNEEMRKSTTMIEEKFCNPKDFDVSGAKHGDYTKLNKYGFVDLETKVEEDDIIIGKVTPVINHKDKLNVVYKDSSTELKSNENGYIDKILTTRNSDGYKIYKVKVRHSCTPGIGDKFACYTPDTEVLTINGWKFITDITKGEKVACLMDRKRLEYVGVKETQEYDYKGKMYNVDTKKVNLCVTPNHRMFTGSSHRSTFKIQKAEEIYGKTRSYLTNIEEWHGDKEFNKKGVFTLPGYEELPSIDLDLELWCLFFGIWMAEGCCNIMYYKTGSIRTRCVNIAANKQRVKDQLEKCMSSFGIECNIHLSKGEYTSWYCGDKRMIYYFHPLSVGATNKTLPEWCFKLNKHYTQKLIEGMVLGNGHYMEYNNKVTTVRYDTSSIKLKDDFQTLCLHAGWGCNSYIKSEAGKTSKCLGKTITTTADAWRLTICKSQTKPLVNKYLTSKNQQQDSWVDYDGKVYCCSVPTPDGLIFVRRLGKGVWCGNSRSGQKGTVGMTFKQEDMPITEDGIIPDLIINSHAIPSRMTIGQLIECLASLGITQTGKKDINDCTAFQDTSIETISNILHESGFNPTGMKTMISGQTGEEMKCQMFIGPTYYQRLKHMVADKIHSRAKGPVQLLTRQPVEGRSRDGGLRLGEMERDVFLSQGVSHFLRERLYDCSDPYSVYVCDYCHRIAIVCPQPNSFTKEPIYRCYKCSNFTKFTKVDIPYSSKLFFQELECMGIGTEFHTE